MNKPTIKITFIICGNEDKFNLDEISDELDILPTESRLKGDIFWSNNLKKELQVIDSSWQYEFTENILLDFKKEMYNFLILFSKKGEVLIGLKDKMELEYKIDVVITNCDKDCLYLVLDINMINFISSIEAILSIDLL